MQQGSEFIYCCNLDCKQPNKIMRDLDEYLESNHNGHRIKKVNLLRIEVQKIETEPYIRQLDFIKFIDNQIESISNLFLSQLSNKLRSFIEIKKKLPDQDFIQLYQALLNDNKQDILIYQNQLDPLLISNQSQLQQQNITFQNIQNQLENLVKFTMDHISEVNKNKFDSEWENSQKLMSSNQFIQAQSLEQRQEKENDVIVQLMSLNQEQELIIENQSNDLEQLNLVLKNEQLQYSLLQQTLLEEQQKSVSIEKELKSTINFVNQLKNQMNQQSLQNDQKVKNIESEKERINTIYQQLLKKQQTTIEQPKAQTGQQTQSLPKGSFEWDNINKHSNFEIQGKIARLIENHTIYKTILFKQQLFYGKTQTVQLKIHAGTVANTYFMIHICDLRALKITCPDFEAPYNCKIFSLKNNGTSYLCDGTKQQTGLILNLQDTIDLQWNGPQKSFTIKNITTQQEKKYVSKFEETAQIYLGVSLNNGASAQIL